MSYHLARTVPGGPRGGGPRGGLGSVSTDFSGRLPRRLPALVLGSLGDDTLSTPTITDPTAQWQQNVLAQLQAGVDTLKMAETQKWLQIAATVSIPVMGFLWAKVFPRLFKRGTPEPIV